MAEDLIAQVNALERRVEILSAAIQNHSDTLTNICVAYEARFGELEATIARLRMKVTDLESRA